MYAAKNAGKNTVLTFETGMHRRALDRLELTGELQQALAQEQFELDYQPVVNLPTRSRSTARSSPGSSTTETRRSSCAES